MKAQISISFVLKGTLSDVNCVEVAESIGGRSSSGLVHEIDEGALVGGEADAARPDLGVSNAPNMMRTALN